MCRRRSVLFAPDIDTISCSPLIELGSSSDDANKIALFRENNRCRFLYLRDDDAIDAAKDTVRLFARALGTKRCAFVVDACFAEMFESCSRSCNDHLLINEGLSRRLHWSGLCVFATELLRGLCGSNDDARNSPKLSKSNLRILSSLASSVLPVIVSDPLWTLPTSLDSDARRPSTGGPRNEGLGKAGSIAILNSNAIMISVLMGFICQFTRALGDDIKLQLPIILFPLLGRASPVGNHSSVQRAAFKSLWEISTTIDYKDISSLLSSNYDYLADVISSRLRKCAREQTLMGRSLMGVVDVILQSLVHNLGPASSAPVAMVGHMLNCLLNHYDRQSYMTSLSIFDTVSVFRSMISFMDASIDLYVSNGLNDSALKTSHDEEKDDWFERLDFELNAQSAGYADSDCGGFDELGPTDEEASPVVNNHDDEEEIDFVQEIGAINCILSRCCYLLGYADLQIQVLCCETILSGFQSLGKIGAFRKRLRGESASNPLLPSIADFWPSIIARLRSASASLASVNRISRSDLSIRHKMATDQEEGPSKASLEVLITKLILIISEFCCSSDGFFADRYENDTYPIIAKLMQDLLPKSEGVLDRKHSLLLPILRCFECSFDSGCRYGLAGLIPSAGTMIFPLLSFNGPIGDAAMDAVKAMLTVDCDALWRGLHALSGRSFPCNPLNSAATRRIEPSSKSVTAVTVARSHRTQGCDDISSLKAGELLDFIDGLPEEHL